MARGRDPLFDTRKHRTPGAVKSHYTFRSRPDGSKFPIGPLPSLYLKPPTKFEQEVLDILQGERDFYLTYQKRIAESTTDSELKSIQREIIASNYSDSAKKIILQLIDRQYDLIREIKGK